MDSDHQVIVAARATDLASDKQQAVAMVEQAIGNLGSAPKEVSADAGYYSAKAVAGLHSLGVDSFIVPDQTRYGRIPSPAPRGRVLAHLSARDRMRRKLRTQRGRQRYAIRKEMVEPVFGQIRHGWGFRRFLMRGLEKVDGEWSLICTGHNLLKPFRFATGRATNASQPAGLSAQPKGMPPQPTSNNSCHRSVLTRSSPAPHSSDRLLVSRRRGCGFVSDEHNRVGSVLSDNSGRNQECCAGIQGRATALCGSPFEALDPSSTLGAKPA